MRRAPEKLHFLAHGGRRLLHPPSPHSRPPHSTTLSKGATSQPKPPDHFHSGAVIPLFITSFTVPSVDWSVSTFLKTICFHPMPCPCLVALPSNSLVLLSSVRGQCKRQQLGGGCTVTDWQMACHRRGSSGADENPVCQSLEALLATEAPVTCVPSMNQFHVAHPPGHRVL